MPVMMTTRTSGCACLMAAAATMPLESFSVHTSNSARFALCFSTAERASAASAMAGALGRLPICSMRTPGHLSERLGVAVAVLKVAMQDGKTLADGVMHARLHVQYGLVARDLSNARKRFLQFTIRLLKQVVRARDGVVEALFLRDVDGRQATVRLAVDLGGVALEQANVALADLDAHAFGQHIVYGRRSAFRDFAQVFP